jgi:hypothetical protein
MWEHDKPHFFDYLKDNRLTFDSPQFKKALQKKGLEQKKRLIPFYVPEYIGQLKIPIPYFTESLATLNLQQDFEYDNTYDNYNDLVRILDKKSSSYNSIDAISERFKLIAIDSNLFLSLDTLCRKNNLIGHENNLACLLKLGYYHYTLAELKVKEESPLAQQEFRELASMAFSNEKLLSIKFFTLKGDGKHFKSQMLKEIITNSISAFLYKNLQHGEIVESIEESGSLVDLQVKYRNLTVFLIVCYLFQEAQIIQLNKEGRLSIPKNIGELIADMLELAELPLHASSRRPRKDSSPANPDTLIRRCFTDSMKLFPILERILYHGKLTDEEYEEYEADKRSLNEYKSRFLRKKGLPN